MRRHKKSPKDTRKNREVAKNQRPIITAKASVRSVVVPKPTTARARRVTAVNQNRIARKYEEQKKRKLADAYKFDDPCAHIGSVGNGL